MPSLRESQTRFAAALAGDGDVGERIAIYRNTVRANYRTALAATYRVVRQLVGAPFFDEAVDTYVQAFPSARGDLNVYGDRFGDFLAKYPHARDLAYLPDVARLEWAVDEAGRAADFSSTPAQVLAELAAIPGREVSAQRFALDPSCRFVVSDYPVFRIWSVHQPGFAGDGHVDLRVGIDWLMVRRETGAVTVERLAPADFAWLRALAARADLAAALETALAVDANFDLGTTLRAYIANRTIAGLAAA